jgi:hypothetical protein
VAGGGAKAAAASSCRTAFLFLPPALSAKMTRSQQRRISAASSWCGKDAGDAARSRSARYAADSCPTVISSSTTASTVASAISQAIPERDLNLQRRWKKLLVIAVRRSLVVGFRLSLLCRRNRRKKAAGDSSVELAYGAYFSPGPVVFIGVGTGSSSGKGGNPHGSITKRSASAIELGDTPPLRSALLSFPFSFLSVLFRTRQVPATGHSLCSVIQRPELTRAPFCPDHRGPRPISRSLPRDVIKQKTIRDQNNARAGWLISLHYTST